MNESSQKQTNYASRVSSYVRSHNVSLGLFLAAYGVFYLSSVILNDWTVADWGKETTGYPPSFINPMLPPKFYQSDIFRPKFPHSNHRACNPLLLQYSRIRPEAAVDKQFVAILLIAFGFTYQIIGVWRLGTRLIFHGNGKNKL
jgi:hypothetical protein